MAFLVDPNNVIYYTVGRVFLKIFAIMIVGTQTIPLPKLFGQKKLSP
jgi:hypothetical protein